MLLRTRVRARTRSDGSRSSPGPPVVSTRGVASHAVPDNSGGPAVAGPPGACVKSASALRSGADRVDPERPRCAVVREGSPAARGRRALLERVAGVPCQDGGSTAGDLFAGVAVHRHTHRAARGGFGLANRDIRCSGRACRSRGTCRARRACRACGTCREQRPVEGVRQEQGRALHQNGAVDVATPGTRRCRRMGSRFRRRHSEHAETGSRGSNSRLVEPSRCGASSPHPASSVENRTVSPGSIVNTGGSSTEKCPCSVARSSGISWVVNEPATPGSMTSVGPMQPHL